MQVRILPCRLTRLGHRECGKCGFDSRRSGYQLLGSKSMKKIYKYELVVRTEASKLRDKVNTLVSMGWQPLGGVAMTETVPGTRTYSQAMVRYEA